MLLKNEYIFFEVKSCKNEPSYVFRNKEGMYVRAHQLSMGRLTKSFGGRYYFVIYREKKEIMVFDPEAFDDLLQVLNEKHHTRIRWDILRNTAMFSLPIGTRPKVFDGVEFMRRIIDG